jgi:hypothetical protein
VPVQLFYEAVATSICQAHDASICSYDLVLAPEVISAAFLDTIFASLFSIM